MIKTELLPKDISCGNVNNIPLLLPSDNPIESAASVVMQKFQLPTILRNFKLFCKILDIEHKTVTALDLNLALAQLFSNSSTNTKFAS